MLTMPVVKQCPYTVAGKGVMRLPHSILATFAGAVYDNNEWMAILIGTRSENGLDITVTNLDIPEQRRSHANCELVKKEPLASNVVGVVHSHHSMRAFFSTTDDDTLNPRFPSSIVVAQPSHQQSEIESLLGFTYKAEGRAALPCGSMGVIEFTVQPTPMVEEWPEVVATGYGTPNTNVTLHECPHATKTLTKLTHICHTKCGIDTTSKATRIFGRDGKAFLKEVEENTKGLKGYQQNYNFHDNRKYFGNQKDGGFRSVESQDDFLRHWGEYYEG